MIGWRYSPERSFEYHLPFHNYAGPGTHIVERVIRGDIPVDVIDEASLIHDIDYLNPNITQYQADNNMFYNLTNNGISLPIAMLVRLGFFLKDITGLVHIDTDYDKYHYLRAIASDKGLLNPSMRFTVDSSLW
jgi:hypothetical protein